MSEQRGDERPFRAGETVEFGPMPGDRYELATVVEDEPVPQVRIRYESDGKESTVSRAVLRRPEDSPDA